MTKTFLLIGILLLLGLSLFAQQIQFQMQYAQLDSGSVVQTFDAKQTPDGGYVLTGLASENTTSVYHPFLIKTDCYGEVQWEKYFGTTQSIANVNARVIITKDTELVMINNLGTYQNYIGLALRCDMQGNILWQKQLNLSNSSDALNDVYETQDDYLIFTGSNKTTSDVSLLKMDKQGNLLWHKSYGNAGQYDDGYAVIETQDGGYVITGRYISMGTFNALLMKTDSAGSVQWLKCYGDSNQHMHGFAVKELSNGDLVMAGSTTLLKQNFQSFSDNFLMKLTSTGDTIWTKIFYGTPDQFELVSSLEVDTQGNFILAVPTASYATSGFVPNKNALMQFDSNGNLLFAKLYNTGSSHYNRISRCFDGTILMSAFSNKYSGPVGFQSLLFKMNEQFETGCFETDVSNQTVVSSIPFKVTQPLPITGSGGTATTNASTFNLVIQDTVLCKTIPNLSAAFTYTDTCGSDSVKFTLVSQGATNVYWNFGDGNTSSSASPLHHYAVPGTYTINLRVSNGCVIDSISKTITILQPLSGLNLGEDTTLCDGQSMILQSNSSGYPLLWNTGDTSLSITISQAGDYILEINMGACGTLRDSINVSYQTCLRDDPFCGVFMPNAFSPNGDQLNDQIQPRCPDPKVIIDYWEIRNRWGNLVFSSKTKDQAWNGTLHGAPAASDTYYYFIKMKCKDESKIMKGDILLIR